MKMALMLAAVALTAAPAAAQESAVDPELAALERTFTYRQGDVALGDGVAILRVPDRFRYLGPDDAKRLLEDGWYKPPGYAPLGMLLPADVSPFSDEGWGVVITFEEDATSKTTPHPSMSPSCSST